MKSKRHTPEQVIRKLAEGDKMLNEGKTVAEVARHLAVRGNLAPVEEHLWRYEGNRCQKIQRARDGEPQTQDDRCRPST